MINIPSTRAAAHEWLLSFKEVKENWLDEVRGERTGSERTQRGYLDILITFVRYMDMTPAEIVAKGAEEVRKEAAKAEGLERKTWGDQTALAFFNWLQTQPMKRTGKKKVRHSAKTSYGAVRSFLRYNGFQFKGKTPIAKSEITVKLPSNEQLAEAWKIAPLHQKLPTAIQRSTGWRPEDVVALKYGDLQNQYDPKRFYIEKVTEKEELPVGVYLTAETTELLRLHIRKMYGDKKPDANERVLAFDYDTLLYHVQRFGEHVGLTLSPKIFRKMFRTRCSPVIGQDAVFKMAGWALPGVGRNYMLPSPEDTLKSYLAIETLLTFEPKAVSDKEQRIQSLIDFAVANGVPVEVMDGKLRVWRAKAVGPEEAAIEIRELIKQLKPAGMLNSEQIAAREFAKILMEALRQVKEMTKSQA